MLRSILLSTVAGFALAVSGCASTGELTTGSLAAAGGAHKAKGTKPEGAAGAAGATGTRAAYCEDIRRSWRPGDQPPTAAALQKRKADNIYCSG